MKDDIVIDIETMGTDDDCKIVSIGAVVFNQEKGPKKEAEFHILVDLAQPNRTVDPSTMEWWEKTAGAEAKERAFKEEGRVELEEALHMLTNFIRKHKPWFCFGCAPDFDMGILAHAYDQFGMSFPVPFWRWQDIRTVENFFYGKNTRKKGGKNWISGVAHDALDDCRMEALAIIRLRRVLERLKEASPEVWNEFCN